MRIEIVIVCVLTMIGTYPFAQYDNQLKSRAGYDPKHSNINLVEPLSSGRQINNDSLDLILFELNPYNHLDLPKLEFLTGGQVTYDLTTVEPSELFGTVLQGLPENWHVTDIDLEVGVSQVDVITRDSLHYLNYCFRAYQTCGDPIGSSSVIIIVDMEGEVVDELPGTADGYFQLTISDDGRFAGYTTGDMVTHCDKSLPSYYGFRILEVSTGLIVYEFEAEGWLLRPISFEGLFVISDKVIGEVGGYSYLYRIVDPINRTEYSRLFSLDEKIRFKQFTPTGIELYESSDKNTSSLMLYTEEFNAKNF